MPLELRLSALTHAMNSSIEVSSGPEEIDRKNQVRPGAVGPETGAILYGNRLSLIQTQQIRSTGVWRQ